MPASQTLWEVAGFQERPLQHPPRLQVSPCLPSWKLVKGERERGPRPRPGLSRSEPQPRRGFTQVPLATPARTCWRPAVCFPCRSRGRPSRRSRPLWKPPLLGGSSGGQPPSPCGPSAVLSTALRLRAVVRAGPGPQSGGLAAAPGALDGRQEASLVEGHPGRWTAPSGQGTEDSPHLALCKDSPFSRTHCPIAGTSASHPTCLPPALHRATVRSHSPVAPSTLREGQSTASRPGPCPLQLGAHHPHAPAPLHAQPCSSPGPAHTLTGPRPLPTVQPQIRGLR